MLLQSCPKAAQFLAIFLFLHLININCIQITKCQEKKIDTPRNIFRLGQGKATVVRVGKT